MRTAINSLILALVLTLAAGPEASAQDRSAQDHSATPTIEFRIGSTSPAMGQQPMNLIAGDTTVYVSDSSFLSDKDLVDVRRVPTAEGLVLHIELTPEGSSRLAKATSSHIGELLAVIVGSRLVSAPVIRGPVAVNTNTLVVTLVLLEKLAGEISNTIAARWPE